MGWNIFVAQYAQEWAKLSADSQIVDAEKVAFRAHIETWNRAGTVTLAKHALAFCYQNQLKGTTIALPDGTLLGHVHRRNDLILMIRNHRTMSEAATEDLLSSWMGLGPTESLDEIRSVIGDLPMSPFILWSFTDEPQDPFAGTDLDEMPCRLGLNEDEYERFFYWSFALPAGVEARRPTAFDAGLPNLLRWQLDGFTQPNARCADKYPQGLQELVHNPPTFASLATPIRAKV